MRCRINRPVSDRSTRRVLAEKVVAFPVFRRPDRSGNKTAAAIRTDVAQDTFDTCGAERTLIGADARLKRVGRQRLVAVLTAWSEFEHVVTFCGGPTQYSAPQLAPDYPSFWQAPFLDQINPFSLRLTFGGLRPIGLTHPTFICQRLIFYFQRTQIVLALTNSRRP